MKKLDHYQCDFCTTTGVKDVVEQHEKECFSDPAKKLCDSCDHFDTYMAHGLYFTEECKKGVDGDSMSDIRAGEQSCKKWVKIQPEKSAE